MALEDAHGFAAGVPSGLDLFEQSGGAGFVAELDHGHPMDSGDELPVPAPR